MRICIINEFFYPDSAGGTGTVLSSLARALRDTYGAVEIDVITSKNLYRGDGRSLPAQEDWEGIRIVRIASPTPSKTSTALRIGANALFSIAALARLAVRPRYDLILVSTAPPPLPFVAHLYRLVTGRPYVYVVYDLEPDRAIAMHVITNGNPLAPLVRWLQKRWLHAAGRTVVLGRCMKDHLVQRYGMRPEQIEVIPIGSDPTEIVPRDRCSRFRAQHGLNGFVVLYTGNFGRYHNFDTILDAARYLRAARPDITFALVGGGAQKEHIEQRVREENISNVRMFPFVPQEEYSDLLATADVSLVALEPGIEGLCVPSKFYSILASGRPTVAMVQPSSEIARVMAEYECGVQIEQKDTDTLIRTLCRLADSPAEIARMGRNARRALMENCTMAHIAERYYLTFLSVIGGDLGQEAIVAASKTEKVPR